MKISLLFLLFPLTLNAAEVLKAHRDPSRDYSQYERRALGSHKSLDGLTLQGTPVRLAKLFPTAQLPAATGWKSMDVLQERFEHMRDVRFLKDADGDLRRSSWLFPDDGCYARAALAMRNLFSVYAPLPSKVFAFGNLKVKTENSPRGAVHWWYHVAPIVEVNGQKYVLDPALRPESPLTLEEWVGLMGNPEKIKVAVCSSGTYSPGDSCERKSDGLELRAERAQLAYFREEEKRLQRLGRETATELGDQPPWLGR